MTEGVEDFSEYVFEGISLGGLTEGDRASPWAAVQVDQRKPPESSVPFSLILSHRIGAVTFCHILLAVMAEPSESRN